MSEEAQETNDGTWSGLKKTIVGTLTTVISGGGTWLGVTLFGSHEEPKEETKTEQSGGQAPITINVEQNQENKQKTENNGGNTVIHERVIEKPASNPQPVQPQPKKEEESW
jgi:hypothetical protein